MTGKNAPICSCECSTFIPFIGSDNIELFRKYDAIQNIVEGTIDEQYRHFLAKPVRKANRKEITWYGIPYTEKPKRWLALNGYEKMQYQVIKDATIGHYFGVIKNKKEDKNSEGYHLLEKALEVIDERFIYCYDGKVVLGIWGMVPRNNNNLVSGEYYAKDVFIDAAQPKITVNTSITGSINETTEPRETNEKEVSHEEEPEMLSIDVNGSFSSDTDQPAVETTDEDNQPDEQEEKDTYPALQKQAGQFKSRSIKTAFTLTITATIVLTFKFCPYGPIQAMDKSAGKAKSVTTKKPDSLPASQENAPFGQVSDSGHTGLNKVPFVEVETVRIDLSINNQINVEEFARAFNVNYPLKEYRIIYCDTLQRIIQIEVPERVHEIIRKELQIKLKKFNLIIVNGPVKEAGTPAKPLRKTKGFTKRAKAKINPCKCRCTCINCLNVKK